MLIALGRIYSSKGGPTALVPGHCDLFLRGSDCKLASSTDKDDILWELVLPAVSTPFGWVRLQNQETGHVLSQTLLSHPPLMIPLSSHHHTGAFLEPGHLREIWSTHWKIVPVSAFPYLNKEWIVPRSFFIVNRLTGGFLRAKLAPFNHLPELGAYDCRVTADEVDIWGRKSKVWTVERAGRDLWTILSNKDEELGECEAKFRNGWLPQLLGEDMEEGRRRWRIVE